MLFFQAIRKALGDTIKNPVIFIPSIIAAIIAGSLLLILIESLEKLGFGLFFAATAGVETLSKDVAYMIGLYILFILISILIAAFVESTTLPMSYELFKTGKTSLDTAWSKLGKHFPQILVFDVLLLIATIVVAMVVGTALLIPVMLSGNLFHPTNIENMIIWVILALIVAWLAIIVMYALLLFCRVSMVVDEKGILEAIKRSYSFTTNHVGDVVLYGVGKLFALLLVLVPIVVVTVILSLFAATETELGKLLDTQLALAITAQTVVIYLINAVFYPIKTYMYCLGSGDGEPLETKTPETWETPNSETNQLTT